MRDRPDSTPVLARLEVPALVIVGEHDRLTPPDQARTMAAAVRRSELCEVAGAGHLANLERPDAFTAALERLLDRLGQAPLTSPGTARRTDG
jgi:pimeloyl-ACP methyl ester carboxylesterase